MNGLPNNVQVSEEIRNLALGPIMDALRFNSYVIRGFRFRTKRVDIRRKSQNSGVILRAEQESYASRKDKNPRSGDVLFKFSTLMARSMCCSNVIGLILKWVKK